MQFELSHSFEILERTPLVLNTLLRDLNENWLRNNEGPETWSPFDVVGHLIHGERHDWIERMLIILNDHGDKRFTPFDRFAQFTESKGKTTKDLLDEFALLRNENIRQLKLSALNDAHLSRTGIHPKFGEVTLRQLLSTWVAHDLAHINQICRVMAKQYKSEIGPWVEYMNIMNER